MIATKITVCSSARTISSGTLPPANEEARPPACSPEPESAGSNTRMTTVNRSSTISQPTATRPEVVSSRLRSSRARRRTTVLATDSVRPRTRPSLKDQPQSWLMPTPSSVATVLCPSAPGMAIGPTAMISRTEKCSPTPNMSRMTPTSASSDARVGAGAAEGRVRANDDARQQITNDGRHAEARGDHTAGKCGDKRGHQGHDEV